MNTKNLRPLAVFSVFLALGLGFPVFGGGNRAASPTPESPQQTAQVSISRVVLYSSGVGYFEFAGQVEDDQELTLLFSRSQLNDVLKSMTVRDLDGGQISSVVYPGTDPVDRTLGSFRIDLGTNPGLPEILRQVRGVDLRVEPSSGASVRGTLVGVQSVVDSDGIGREELTLQTSRGLQTYYLDQVSSVAFEDPALDRELAQALNILATQSDTEVQPVRIQFTGTGTRQVRVSFVSETPVWKTSYRVDLGAFDQGQATLDSYLQAWAIVENTSEVDWDSVQLSLVSGSPVSFIQDLATPLYVQRPVVAVQAQEKVAPQTYAQGAMADEAYAFESAPVPAPAAAPRASRSSVFSAPVLEASGVQPGVQGNEGAYNYEFALEERLSIPRHQSGLIPLVAQDIPGRLMSIYTFGSPSVHPYAGVQLENTTGSRLPPGPVTFFQNGIYAGDGLLQTWGRDEKRIITFAQDLSLRIRVQPQQTQAIARISINQGVLRIERRVNYVTEYEIQPGGERETFLILEHPRNSSRTLEPLTLDGVNLEETTLTQYRFGLALPAGPPVIVPVKEYQILEQSIGLLSTRPETFLAYLSEGTISPAVSQALERAAQLRRAIETVENRIAGLNQARSTAVNNQSRVRSNLEAVDRETTQGQVFLTRLLDLENEIDRIDADLVQAREDLAIARSWFETFVNDLTVE